MSRQTKAFVTPAEYLDAERRSEQRHEYSVELTSVGCVVALREIYERVGL
jgi:hypothetical protein